MAGLVTAAATIVTSQVVLTGFGILFGGGLLGLAIGKILPKAHLGEGTLPMVQAAMGTLSILSALVLGFLINSAKAKFENCQCPNRAVCQRPRRYWTVSSAILAGTLSTPGTVCAAMRPLRSPRPGRKRPASRRLMIPLACDLLDQFQAALRGLTPKTEEER